jgi:hypothetical protein
MSEEKPAAPESGPAERKPRKGKTASTRNAAIALGAVGITLLALILFVPAPDGTPRTGTTGPASAQTTGSPSPGTMPAGEVGSNQGAYRPLPALEALIGSLRRRAEFRVVSPGETAEKGTLIVFRWETELSGPWKVSILDNRGIALKEEDVTEPDYTLSSPKPALYYWTVAKEDTLLHAGRLSVR